VIPDTNTGTKLSLVVPSPKLPPVLSPQHCTVPSAIDAHEYSPLLTLTAEVDAVNPEMPDTKTGTRLP
jgi:hypothetical protein